MEGPVLESGQVGRGGLSRDHPLHPMSDLAAQELVDELGQPLADLRDQAQPSKQPEQQQETRYRVGAVPSGLAASVDQRLQQR